MHPIVHHPVVTKLSELFGNADFTPQLASVLGSVSPDDEGVCLRIDAVVCASNISRSNIAPEDNQSLSLVRSTRELEKMVLRPLNNPVSP